MRCLSCKYDLRNLPEHRCPECGRQFDPNDAQTFQTPRSRKRAIICLSCLICGLPVVVWLLFQLERTPNVPSRPELGSLLGYEAMIIAHGLIGMFATGWALAVIALVVITFQLVHTSERNC